MFLHRTKESREHLIFFSPPSTSSIFKISVWEPGCHCPAPCCFFSTTSHCSPGTPCLPGHPCGSATSVEFLIHLTYHIVILLIPAAINDLTKLIILLEVSKEDVIVVSKSVLEKPQQNSAEPGVDTG